MKIFRMLLAIVIALGLASAPKGEAEASASPAITATSSVQGETVKITIKGNGINNLYGVQLQIAYDETALQFVSAKPRYFSFATQSQVNTDAYDLLDASGAPVGFYRATAGGGIISIIASQVKQGVAVAANAPVLDLQFQSLRTGASAISVENAKLMELLQDVPSPIAEATLSLSLNGSTPDNNGSSAPPPSQAPAAGFLAAVEAIMKDAALSTEQRKEKVRAYIAAHLPAMAVYSVPLNSVSEGEGGSSSILAKLNAQALNAAIAAYTDLLKQLKPLAAAAGVNDFKYIPFRIQMPPSSEAESVQLELPAAAALALKQADLALRMETSVGGLAGMPSSFLQLENAKTVAYTIGKLKANQGTGVHVALQVDQAAVLRFPGPIQVNFPYTLQPGEQGERFIIVRVNEDGSEVPVVNSWYDAAFGQMVFRTSQPGAFIARPVSSFFSDIQSHWSKQAVELLADRGVIKGKSGNRFDPQGQVTREEFAAMIIRAFELTADHSSAPLPFKDINADRWSADAIRTAYSLGIVNGTSSTAFSPKQAITREQLATMLYKSAQATQLQLPDSNPPKVSDLNDASPFAQDSLSQLLQAGIMQGDDRGAVNPRKPATRAEAAMMIFKMIMAFREEANVLQ